jgi:hypothetical protein
LPEIEHSSVEANGLRFHVAHSGAVAREIESFVGAPRG